jgi:DNA-binding transcriptional ArsR family regulator
MVTDRTFFAIADPTRRGILDLLRAGERSAGELAGAFTVSRPAVSRHIRVLKMGGLIRERRSAQHRYYSLEPTPLAGIDQWLDAYRVFWGARLHGLKRHVEARHGATKAEFTK